MIEHPDDSQHSRSEGEIMRDMTAWFERSPRRSLTATAASAMVALLVAGQAQSGLAQQSSPASFPSPEAASQALYSAVQQHDENAVMAVLGAERELIHADDVEDKLLHEQFIRKYQQMHRLVREPDGTTVLYIGAENWPFPVPLVSTNGTWRFDAPAGVMEVLFRRIGENEAAAIQACHALVTAGTRSDVASPSRAIDANQTPYYGYYFRTLAPQGQNSSSAAQHSADAFVAYPAEYRSSGVMTFIVGADGAVYQKDLGPDTAAIASAMTAIRPDTSWQPVGE
jgi:hypothetical protein